MKKKTFIEHLGNLRTFVYFFMIFALLLFLILYIFFKNQIIHLFVKLLKSMEITNINYLHIYDGFLLPLKLVFYLSSFLLIIIIIICFLIFIEEKILNIYFLSSLPIILYINFAYLIPISWKSFYHITPILGSYFITLGEILNFIIHINLCGLMIFYLPLFLIILYAYKIISEKAFKKVERYWCFISVIISGIMAPADIISHLLMSIFMIIVFYLLLFIITFLKKIQKK